MKTLSTGFDAADMRRCLRREPCAFATLVSAIHKGFLTYEAGYVTTDAGYAWLDNETPVARGSLTVKHRQDGTESLP